MIPITNTVINRVIPIMKLQPELIIYTDRKDQIIRNFDIEILGVDRDKNEAWVLQISNDNNIDYQEDQEDIHTIQLDQYIQQSVSVQL